MPDVPFVFENTQHRADGGVARRIGQRRLYFRCGRTTVRVEYVNNLTLASAQVETTLLALKIAFLVLLYLFIWRIVRSAARDLRLPQESMILGPQQAAAAGLVPQPQSLELGRLVVLSSPALEEGDVVTLDAHPLTVGRGRNNDVALPEDDYASSRHARFEPRRDGVYVEDIGSTNGTFVNGIRVSRERRLVPGDVVRIGETDLRFES